MAPRNAIFPTWHRSAKRPELLPIAVAISRTYSSSGVYEWCWRIARIGLTIALSLLGADVARRGVAQYYYEQRTMQGLRRALFWAPESAKYHAALAEALENSPLESDPREPIRLSEEATRLAPLEAPYWAGLGSAYEAGGQEADARAAYERAVALFPRSPEMNWRLGNFLLREDDAAGALAAFQKVLIASPSMRRVVYQTAWGASEDSKTILERMIPPQPEIFQDYFRYLLDTERLDAAREVWWRMLDSGFPVERAEIFRYIDALLADERTEDAIAAWEALTNRAPGVYAVHHRTGNRVTNGGFETPVLGGGLGWRIAHADGVTVRTVTAEAYEGAHFLEVQFAGTTNVEFAPISQFVPVEPATRYVFSARVRTKEISSDSGPRFLVRDAHDERRLRAETSAVLGTTHWTELKLEFESSPATRLIEVRLVRPHSGKLDGRIGGTLWVDDVRVEARP